MYLPSRNSTAPPHIHTHITPWALDPCTCNGPMHGYPNNQTSRELPMYVRLEPGVNGISDPYMDTDLHGNETRDLFWMECMHIRNAMKK